MMTDEERKAWHAAGQEAMLEALRQAGKEQYQRRLREQSEEERLKKESSDSLPEKTND